MTRLLTLLLLVGLLPTTPAAAQYRGPRSADHLFSASSWGSRALWLNPAALGGVEEASIMIEALVERDPAGDYPLSQYTIGFNSRGFGFGFRRDFFHVLAATGDSMLTYGGNTWRLGFGRGLGPLAIGATVSMYSGRQTKQDVDIGLRYQIARGLNVSIGVEHIGQPTVRDSSLRFGGIAGLSWRMLNGVLGLDGEIQAHDRHLQGGYLMGYRGGLRIATPGALPLTLTGVIEITEDFDVARVLAGFAVGREYLASLVGGGWGSGTDHLGTLSLLGEASKSFR